MKPGFTQLILLATFWLPTSVGFASSPWLPALAGARAGVSDHRKPDTFIQEEVFLQWDLPWHWTNACNWGLRTEWEVSCGHFGAAGRDSFIGSLGPVARLSWGESPLFLDVGVKPTWLSRHQFAAENLGGNVQFISHAQIGCTVWRRCEIAYRYQHMSNARIYAKNPGVNLHLLTFQYRF